MGKLHARDQGKLPQAGGAVSPGNGLENFI